MTAPFSVRVTIGDARHVLEFFLLRFRRLWRGAVLSSFLTPLMYLAGIGIGVGTLVERNGTSADILGGVDYAAFLAPGLLATTAMMVAANEATWPVLGGFKWGREFHAQSTTPIGATAIVLGMLWWLAVRTGIAAAAVAATMALLPMTRTWGLVPAVPSAVLCGLAFAAPTMAFSATKERDNGFVGYQRFLMTPLFLFGGAFYPIEQLPEWLRPVAQATPLWHGVELCRHAAQRTLSWWPAIGHAAYLAGWTVGGFLVARRIFVQRLAKGT